MRRVIGNALTLSVAVALPVAGQQGTVSKHPESLDLMDWKAASYVLNPDGSVATERTGPRAARRLTLKSAGFVERYGSAARHGLREGDYPPRELCVGGEWTSELVGVSYAIPESDFKFDASVLLGEVAVTATVSEVMPGFSSEWPHSLLALTDVVPLHDASPTPAYVLVPVGRVVTHDRVFCGGDPNQSAGYNFSEGTRLVVVGSWRQGVVPVVSGAGDSGLLGVIDADGSIDWMMPMIEGAPADLARLHQRIDDMAAGGLLELRALTSRQEPYSDDRKMVRDLVREQYREGCRIIGYARLGEVTRISRVCESGTPEEAAAKLDRPAAELCDGAESRDSAPGMAWEALPDCGLYQ
ncbi:MAG: hypothetical protein OXH70_01675 [Acidobacteria bacterium]|nr:hypothetical protein [Acidobacteriota bacterium]